MEGFLLIVKFAHLRRITIKYRVIASVKEKVIIKGSIKKQVTFLDSLL